MACLRNWILLASLTPFSFGQSTGSSSLISTTASTTSIVSTSTVTSKILSTHKPLETPHPLSSYVWNMPFVGISDNASHVWGPFGWLTGYAYSITINDSNPVPLSSVTTRLIDILSEARAENNAVEDDGYTLNIITNNVSTMVLGANSALGASYAGVDLNETVPTVPFGLNLGHNGTWDGSLILGGSNAGASYDANRVASGSWAYIPESANGHGTFLRTGKQQLTNITIQQYSSSSIEASHAPFGGANPLTEPSTYSAVLDISHDAIVLPAGLNFCGRSNFTVTLTTRSVDHKASGSYQNNLIIPIPTSLTVSADRCYTLAHNSANDTIILGRPFFQAAYLMIPDDSGQIWLAAAHDYDLKTNPQLFFPNITLTAAANPADNTGAASSIPTSSPGTADEDTEKRTGSIIGGTLGAVFGLALVSLIVFLVLRRRKIARSHFWKATPTETDLLTGIPMEARDNRS